MAAAVRGVAGLLGGRHGIARQADGVRRGADCSGFEWQLRRVGAWCSSAFQGSVRRGSKGVAAQVAARFGRAEQGNKGPAGQGQARQGSKGSVRRGADGLGPAGVVYLVNTRFT